MHGHDDRALDQLNLILHLFKLAPYILKNKTETGETIIEALEKQIGKTYEANFGIVLLTPDDMGYSASDEKPDPKPRARQNVVLEMGMMFSSLTRKRMIILLKGKALEPPSDTQGIIYVRFSENVKEAAAQIASHLNKAGYDIDADKISEASS